MIPKKAYTYTKEDSYTINGTCSAFIVSLFYGIDKNIDIY